MTTLIDDLLAGTGEPEPAKKAASWRRRLFSLLASAACWALIGYAMLRLAERTVSIPALLAVALTVLLVRRLVRWLRPPPRPRQAGRTRPAAGTTPDGLALAVTRWARLLDWSHTDAARFQRRVQPRLAELAEERLRQRHGVSLKDDPERSRQLLGDPLWKLAVLPVRRPPSPRELDAAVTALERV